VTGHELVLQVGTKLVVFLAALTKEDKGEVPLCGILADGILLVTVSQLVIGRTM
jgi:hypothetical protein